MNREEEKIGQRRAWQLAAMAAPAAHLAAGLGWWSASIVVTVSMALHFLPGKDPEKADGYGMLRWGISVMAILQAMHFLRDCWGGQESMGWIIAILFGLAVYISSRGKERTMEASIILWWMIGFLFGSVLLSAVPQITILHLEPQLRLAQWNRGAALLTVLLIPDLMPEQRNRREVWQTSLSAGAMVLAFALCGQGVLSFSWAAEQQAPFYALTRSIRLYGALDRMESLAWLGLMLGSVVYFSYVLTIAAENGRKTGKAGQEAWILGAAILAAWAYGIGLTVSSSVVIILIILYGCRGKKRERKKH